MQKLRVWELAKKYNKESKEIIETLRAHQVTVSSHTSTVDEAGQAVLERAFAPLPEPVKAPAASGAKRRRGPVRTVRFDQKSGKPKEEFLTDGRGRKWEEQAKKETAKKESAAKPATPAKAAAKPAAEAKPAAPKQKVAAAPAQETPVKPAKPAAAAQTKQPAKESADKQEKPRQEKPQQAKKERPARPARKESGAERPQRTERSQRTERQPRREERVAAAPAAEQKEQKRGKRNERRNRNRNEERRNRERGTSLLAESIRKSKSQRNKRNERTTEVEAVTEVALPPSVTVKELAELFRKEVGDVIKRLMLLGIMATINQEVDRDAIELLADEYGITLTELPPEEDDTEIEEIVDAPEDLQLRPPVVTIMGHVDHGKTSLLDTIRKTNVTAREAGGITQHIGAYRIRYEGKKIVFLDTPGHEAFTAMRARGAQVTDIAVLVVAADDGVMPQTIEAINHAKAAKVPIVVAINKIDKPTANPDHIRQQLAEHGLLAEDWGGDVIMVPVSAKKSMGIDDLLENILLVAEVLELKANPDRDAVGVVIEGELDKGRGPVVTVLIQHGTMHIGDGIVAGTAYGRVRAMNSDTGDAVKKAEPSTPVEILGLSEVPPAGELIYAMDERRARSIAEKRIAKQKYEEQNRAQKVTLDDLFNQIKEGELKNLNIVSKADVQGSVEALRQSFEGIKNPEVRIDIVHAGVGAISESDIMLASAANALIIGFNVRPDAQVRRIAEEEKVDMRTYRVIYDAIDDVKMAMQGMLAPKFRELVLGRAEVRQVIPTPRVIVAGSYVTEGKITNSASLRLIRDGIVIHEGHIASLRRFKDDVREVAEGYECGIAIESYRDVKEGDVIEAFTEEEIEQTLE
ncbi:MAG: translation initiation factor IF-2 [Veillonellaceae bacterium]|nr:translation initiation factor IF-2 [Veillonellaceae bacterium]